MDHASRYLLGCQGLDGTRLVETKAEFERLLREYGLPERMRTHNGMPFASSATGGLSQLSVWWIRLGNLPKRIELGQPQQNGCHEHMQRSLKSTVTHPPAANQSAQQVQFDSYRTHCNEQHPHEWLGSTVHKVAVSLQSASILNICRSWNTLDTPIARRYRPMALPTGRDGAST